jgi:hypothetical protein
MAMRTRALARPLVLAACLAAAAAAGAQPGAARPHGPKPREVLAQAGYLQRPGMPPGLGGQMTREERERLREDLRATERDRYRRHGEGAERGEDQRRRDHERWREERTRRKAEAGRLTPEERERLRRDVLDANRGLRR